VLLTWWQVLFLSDLLRQLGLQSWLTEERPQKQVMLTLHLQEEQVLSEVQQLQALVETRR